MSFSSVCFNSVRRSVTHIICCALLIISGNVMTASAHAQALPGPFLPEDLRLTLIYPEAVSSGEAINLFLRIDNIGDRVWTGLNTHLDNPLSERYLMRNCRSDCGPQPISLQPGQTNFFFVGTLYPFEIRESVSVLPIRNLRLGGATVDSSFNTVLSPVEIVVNYRADTDPAHQPVPLRQPLVPADFLTAGDNLLIHDPNTGADWLKLDASVGYMPQQIFAAMEPGGVLEEFRVARVRDVENAILNHVHANGIAATRQQLYWWPREELYDAMADFVTMMRSQRYPEESVWASGFVANKSLPWFTLPALTHLNVSIGYQVACAGECEFGIRTQSGNAEQAMSQPISSGVWLVRGVELPARPQNHPSYFDGELWIPDVKIDEQHYQAVLKLKDTRLQVFQLAEISPVQTTDTAVELDSVSGRLTIPNIRLINADGSSTEQAVDFLVVPGSSPQALLLTTPGVLLD